MNKVILKSKIADRDAFEVSLEKKGYDLGLICWLHDRIYTPRGYRSGTNQPRLIMRTTMRAIDEPPVYTLILKRHIEDSGLDIVEETKIEDYAAIARIAMQLGFTESGEVSRRRQTLQISENTEIHLDELDGAPETAATYAKLESIITSPTASVTAVRDGLIKILQSLGIDTLANRPYSEL